VLTRLIELLQLPCHQSLTDRDMDWMMAAITKVGAGETARHPTCP
jgi:hypothetical protein